MQDAAEKPKPVRPFTPPPAKPLRWRRLLTWLRCFTWRSGVLAALLVGATVLFAFTRDPWVKTAEIVLPIWQWVEPPLGAEPVVFSPDGRHVLIGRKDGVLAVHDAATGNLLAEHPGGPALISHVAVSADGRWALTVGGAFGRGINSLSADPRLWPLDTATLWDLDKGRPVREWNVLWRFTLPRFSPDGKRIWTGTGDGLRNVAEWAAESPDSRPTSRSRSQVDRDLAGARFCAARKRLIGWTSTQVLLLDEGTGKTREIVGQRQPDQGYIVDVIPSPDGACAVALQGHQISMQMVRTYAESAWWLDLSTGATKWLLADRLTQGLSVAFSPDGRHFALSDGAGGINMFRAADGREIEGFNPSAVETDGPLAFSPDGRFLLTGLSAGWPCYTPYLLDADSGEVRFRFLDATYSPVNHVAFSPDGERLLIAAGHQRVHLYEKRSEPSAMGVFGQPAFWAMGVLAMALPFNVLFDARRRLPAERKRPVGWVAWCVAVTLSAIGGLAMLDTVAAATTQSGSPLRWPPAVMLYRYGMPVMAALCVLMAMGLVRGNRAWRRAATILAGVALLYLSVFVFGLEYRTRFLAGGWLSTEAYGLPVMLPAHGIAWALAMLSVVVAGLAILLLLPLIRKLIKRLRPGTT